MPERERRGTETKLGETSNGGMASGGSGEGKAVWRRAALLIGLLLVVAGLARVLGAGEKLWGLRSWLASLGPWGPVAFLLIYIAAVVAAIPGTALSVVAGALFGSLPGVILVNIGATVGGALAFLISRYFAREAVTRWLARSKQFQKLDSLTAQHGAIIVALTRLVPIFPFNVLNYAFGLTRVPFWTYVFWSWTCELPGTILYVVGGDAVFKLLIQGKISWPLVGIFVVAMLLVAVVVRHARKKMLLLKKTIPPGGQELESRPDGPAGG